jgi:predicted DNA-binding transcriptional regulator AlpA
MLLLLTAQMTEATQLLRPEDVAEMLGITRADVLRLPIPFYTLGKRLKRWNPKDVAEYIATRPIKLEVFEAEEIARRATTAPNMPGIYILLFEGEIVYVGQSICPLRRLGDHSSDKGKFFDAYVHIPCRPRDLLALEGLYISKFKPKYNKAGNYPDLPPE